jgi:L-ascorbate metabolism protein UlaG (beta-lactamase superfamily)
MLCGGSVYKEAPEMSGKATVLVQLAVLLLLGAWGCKNVSETPPPDANVSSPKGQSKVPDNTIWHFEQSGFLVKVAGRVLIFDYAVSRRPTGGDDDLDRGVLNPEQIEDEIVYVFVSHGHGDHFNRRVFLWQQRVRDIKYILSSDIRRHPSDALIVAPGQERKVDDLTVRTYPSSDQGVAFSVYVGGKHIYFAGDNAFWNWRENMTDEDYVTENLSFIDRRVPIDMAFQVCDPRLDGKGSGGIYIFAVEFEPKLLVPIHSCGDYEFNKKAEVQLRQRGFKNRFWPVARWGDSISF